MRYAKAIAGLLGAAAAALTAALADGSITGAEWAGIFLAVVTGAAVFGVPNHGPAVRPSTDNLP